MSIAELIALVGILCSRQPTPELKYECKEKLVNCAIVEGGRILTTEEFKKKCQK